jgi:hypothetical protein
LEVLSALKIMMMVLEIKIINITRKHYYTY